MAHILGGQYPLQQLFTPAAYIVKPLNLQAMSMEGLLAALAAIILPTTLDTTIPA